MFTTCTASTETSVLAAPSHSVIGIWALDTEHVHTRSMYVYLISHQIFLIALISSSEFRLRICALVGTFQNNGLQVRRMAIVDSS